MSTAVVTFGAHRTWSACSWAWQTRGCQSSSLLASVSFFHVKGPLCYICVVSMRCQSRCPAPFWLNWGAPDHMRPVGMTSPGNLASDLEDGSHLCWLCIAVAHQGSWSHFLLPRLFHPRAHCTASFFSSVGSVLPSLFTEDGSCWFLLPTSIILAQRVIRRTEFQMNGNWEWLIVPSNGDMEGWPSSTPHYCPVFKVTKGTINWGLEISPDTVSWS